MKYSLQDRELKIPCPGCKKEITIKVKDVGTSIKCPYCKKTIHLEDDGFSKGTKKVEKSINDLMDSLKKLGR